MTDSLHSCRTTTDDSSQDKDPEALGKGSETPTENDVSSSEKGSSPWEVTLEKNEDPKNMATWYKWLIVLTISSGAMCVTSASSMASFLKLHLSRRA